MGIPWQFSGEGLSAFTAGAWVQSLVRKLRSYKPHGTAKRKSQQNTHNQNTKYCSIITKILKSPHFGDFKMCFFLKSDFTISEIGL